MANLLQHRQIIIADDDPDDILLFRDALDQLPMLLQVITVPNGEQLVAILNEIETLPDIVFLDLNMPVKNGTDCLTEVKQSKKLQAIPVVIFSTSTDSSLINKLYQKGAQYFIGKPNNFTALKEVIWQVLCLTAGTSLPQPSRDNFVLAPEKNTHGIK